MENRESVIESVQLHAARTVLHGSLICNKPSVAVLLVNTKHCIAFVQGQANVKDVGPTWYKFYALCFVFAGLVIAMLAIQSQGFS